MAGRRRRRAVTRGAVTEEVEAEQEVEEEAAKSSVAPTPWWRDIGKGETGEDGSSTLFGLPEHEVVQPLAVLYGSQFVLFMGVGALLPALPLYAQSIGLSGSANGVVISAPALAMLLLNLPSGQLADKWGRKRMMIAVRAVCMLNTSA